MAEQKLKQPSEKSNKFVRVNSLLRGVKAEGLANAIHFGMDSTRKGRAISNLFDALKEFRRIECEDKSLTDLDKDLVRKISSILVQIAISSSSIDLENELMRKDMDAFLATSKGSSFVNGEMRFMRQKLADGIGFDSKAARSANDLADI